MLEEQMARFTAYTMVTYGLLPEDAVEVESYGFEADGCLYQYLCTCPPCQADVQCMKVVDVVDQMRALKLIKDDEVADVREQAEVIDARRTPPFLN